MMENQPHAARRPPRRWDQRRLVALDIASVCYHVRVLVYLRRLSRTGCQSKAEEYVCVKETHRNHYFFKSNMRVMVTLLYLVEIVQVVIAAFNR